MENYGWLLTIRAGPSMAKNFGASVKHRQRWQDSAAAALEARATDLQGIPRLSAHQLFISVVG